VICKRMKERPDDIEKLGLLCLDDHGQHLPVEIGSNIVGSDQRLELLETVFVVEKLAAVCQVLPQVMVSEAQLVEQDRGPVGSEATAVKAHVEQPVVFVVRLLGGGVEQILARWI